MANLLFINLFATLNSKKENSNVTEDIKTIKRIRKLIKELEKDKKYENIKQ